VQNIVYCTPVNPNGATPEQRILVSVRYRQVIITAVGFFTESNYKMRYQPNPIFCSIKLSVYNVFVCIVKSRTKKTHKDDH
jgi:hypothetical protein